jgi:hypothetical protein
MFRKAALFTRPPSAREERAIATSGRSIERLSPSRDASRITRHIFEERRENKARAEARLGVPGLGG